MNEIDELERKEREFKLKEIAHNARKRAKIENYNDNEGKMSPELAQQLNDRKKLHNKKFIQPEKLPEPLTDAETLKRTLMLQIHNEDFPEPETGIDLWNTTERRKQQKLTE